MPLKLCLWSWVQSLSTLFLITTPRSTPCGHSLLPLTDSASPACFSFFRCKCALDGLAQGNYSWPDRFLHISRSVGTREVPSPANSVSESDRAGQSTHKKRHLALRAALTTTCLGRGVLGNLKSILTCTALIGERRVKPACCWE
jgi:hypothetical protein